MRTVEAIRKENEFENSLYSVAASSWMTEEQMKDPETTIVQTLPKIKTVDGYLEILLGKIDDEDLRIALGRAYFSDVPLSSARELMWPPYLPAGRTQSQIGLIEAVSKAAQTHADTDLGREWKADGIIGVIDIEGTATELHLHRALELFVSYLKPAEEEFYKQWLSGQMHHILHEYEILSDGKKKLSLPDTLDYLQNYRPLYVLFDRIYYGRAMNFISENRKLWDLFARNKQSRKYLLTLEEASELARDMAGSFNKD